MHLAALGLALLTTLVVGLLVVMRVQQETREAACERAAAAYRDALLRLQVDLESPTRLREALTCGHTYLAALTRRNGSDQLLVAIATLQEDLARLADVYRQLQREDLDARALAHVTESLSEDT